MPVKSSPGRDFPDTSLSIERFREALRASTQYAIESLNDKQRLVLITIDIHRFREINNSFGVRVGDEVLRLVADRLLEVLRPEDVLFRTGDDEFSILLNPVLHRDHALLAVHKIQRLFTQPLTGLEHEHSVGLRIGISICPDTATNADELIRQSVLALGQAQEKALNFVMYEASMEVGSRNARQLSEQVEEGMRGGEMALMYQPVYAARDLTVVGVEGLARWTRADGSKVPPAHFIPVLEQTGAIRQFSQWALNTALRECAGFKDWFVAVNISAINLADVEFPDLVRRALSTWSVNPRQLVLEVTETAMMQDLEKTKTVLDRVSELGVRLSIDDFGSGYSSLKYIKDLPVSYLKIDGEFIERLEDSDADKQIVDAVSKLGHSFGLGVVAESISTAKNCAIAVELGCDFLQGNYLSEPVPIASLDSRLAVVGK